MSDFIEWLFETEQFKRRVEGFGWPQWMDNFLNVCDAALVLSMATSAFLLWFQIRRRHLVDLRPVFALLSLSIFATAMTRAFVMLCSFWPAYHFYLVLMAAVAALSVSTSVCMISAAPRVIATPRLATMLPILESLRLEGARLRESVVHLQARDPKLAEEETRRALAEVRDIADRIEGA